MQKVQAAPHKREEVRFKFISKDFKYEGSHREVKILNRTIHEEQMSRFWNKYEELTKNFDELKGLQEVPVITIYIAYALFVLGLIFLIVGVLPIHSGEFSPQIALFGGVMMILSLLQKCLITSFVRRRYLKPLFTKYKTYLNEAIKSTMADFIKEGLKCDGGKDGFKEISLYFEIPAQIKTSYISIENLDTYVGSFSKGTKNLNDCQRTDTNATTRRETDDVLSINECFGDMADIRLEVKESNSVPPSDTLSTIGVISGFEGCKSSVHSADRTTNIDLQGLDHVSEVPECQETERRYSNNQL